MTDFNISGPQKVARLIYLGDIQVVARLQKPMVEDPEDIMETISAALPAGYSLPEGFIIEEWDNDGTTLVFEAWCEATETVISFTVVAGDEQDEEDFTKGCRYLLNEGTDDEIISVLEKQNLLPVIKLVCKKYNQTFVEPTVKDKK